MWRKVKTFLHIFISSIVPQTSYYAKILKSKWSFSLLYSFGLLTSITCAIFFVILFQVGKNDVESIRKCFRGTLNEIPSNFVLNVRDGLLSTNHELPLFVWFDCDERIQLLAVVDERGVSKNINSFGAQIMITGSEIVLKYKTNTYAVPINKYISNLHFDRQNIIAYANQGFETLAFYFPFFTLSLALLSPLVIYLVTISTILLSSLCVYLFYRLFKRRYSFKKIVQIGLHSCTLPLLTLILFVLFPIHIINTYILFFALIFIFQLVAVYEGHYSNM